MQPCLAFFVRLKEDIDLGWDAAIIENTVSWIAMNPSKQDAVNMFLHLLCI